MATNAMSVDIRVESDLWGAETGAPATVRQALAVAAESVRRVTALGGDVSVVLTDDAAVRKLNGDWRGLDKATNVLSFPAPPILPAPACPAIPGGGQEEDAAPVLLGDIVIAYETTAREAGMEGKPFAHHLAHLAVHGFLHLLGYDHDSDEDADEMERLEAEILMRLGVPDPYLTRAHEA